MKDFIRVSNALLILVLMGVISSAFYEEFTREGPPCPLCFLQRLGMIGIATAILMNLRFGIRIKHYVLALFSAGIGGAVSTRQILLHICPNFPTFGYPVLGLGLYTWAFIVFCCSAISIGVFLFLYQPDQAMKVRMSWLDYLAFLATALVTLGNIILTIYQCHFGSCKDVPWPPKNPPTSLSVPAYNLLFPFV